MTGAPAITAEQFEALLREQVGVGHEFPVQVTGLGRGLAELRLPFSPRYLRPGEAISGPTLFTLADTALYAAVLSVIGLVPLAVTTEMSIHFMRKAGPLDVVAKAEVLKPGRLLVGVVALYSAGDPAPVAHATGTYSAPPARA